MAKRLPKARKRATRGSGNVYADLGLPNAAEMQLKANLVRAIARIIEEKGMSQSEAAKRIGLAQPDVSKMLRGQFRGIGLERMLSFARKLGSDIEIKVEPEAVAEGNEGRIRLMVA